MRTRLFALADSSMTHLLRLLRTGSGSDVDVVTSDGTVHRLHKFLLSAASPVIAELVKYPNTDEDGADGRTVLRDVFARFPSEHIRIIIAVAYCLEIGTMSSDEEFTASNERGRYRPDYGPATVMAIFETLAYFQVPLPRWLKMERPGTRFLYGNQCMHGETKSHVLGYYTMICDSGDKWHAEPLLDPAHIEIYATTARTKGDSYEYTEEAIDMINSHFESKEKSIRSFRVVRPAKPNCLKVYINGERVETIYSYGLPVLKLRVGELCVEWMRMQNQHE